MELKYKVLQHQCGVLKLPYGVIKLQHEVLGNQYKGLNQYGVFEH